MPTGQTELALGKAVQLVEAIAISLKKMKKFKVKVLGRITNLYHISVGIYSSFW
ncbi:hypothetical protein COO91_09859 (plasmid) [Nostoc flagelliforme CCNUN1]|uniref:Uncharacterized protein n=1 Tax=Nostoc flagelliforme CCNUN1 TaxID=2038116 RepID=A0A2K8T9D2_9NOSO|nr:hypothetical protein COO91_09859 [Nostoc flagelliforme CCNUN1]